jgi:hypothetical protein
LSFGLDRSHGQWRAFGLGHLFVQASWISRPIALGDLITAAVAETMIQARACQASSGLPAQIVSGQDGLATDEARQSSRSDEQDLSLLSPASSSSMFKLLKAPRLRVADADRENDFFNSAPSCRIQSDATVLSGYQVKQALIPDSTYFRRVTS